MQRRQLIEVHEQSWCPATIRDGATDCLRAIAVIGRQFNRAVPILQRLLTHTGTQRIVDLGSGGGGPWLALHDRLRTAAGEPIPITLTDLLPNRAALQSAKAQAPHQIEIVTESVDATHVPAHLDGVRTLFTTFHHFDPPTARAILQDAVNAGQGIAIFEQTRRSLSAMLFMVVLAPLALVAVLLARPFRWSRLFWSYVIPAIPAVLLVDGIVSCLRTYTEDELREMTEGLSGREYVWEIGRAGAPLSPLGIGYLIGYPATPSQRDAAAGSAGPRVARTT